MGTDYSLPVSDAYLQYLANGFSRSNKSLRDDLVQEGRIAVWLAVKKYPGKPLSYYVTTAKNRMIAVSLRGESQTGQPSRYGKRYDALDKALDSLDSEIDEEGTTLSEIIVDRRYHGPNDLAYHRKEIRSALDNLPPDQREFAECIFQGFKPFEIEKLTGYDRHIWQDKARKTLRHELAHLEELVS